MSLGTLGLCHNPVKEFAWLCHKKKKKVSRLS
jgi:hypothetical protein